MSPLGLSLTLLLFLSVASSLRQKLVIIDTDGGGDDAMAILMMLSKESNVQVVAITCVVGNTGIFNVSQNVLKILHVVGRTNIPVYLGSDQGLVYYTPTDNFFGSDGLGEFNYPYELNYAYTRAEHAAEFLVKATKFFPGQLTVLALGPLTNIAIAIHLYPNFLSNLKELVVLGGSYQGKGNVKPGLEFNIYNDPEAASFVFSKVTSDSLPTVFPIETVESAGYPKEWRTEKLGSIQSSQIKFLNQAERLSIQKVKTWEPYDPLAAAYVLRPEIGLNDLKTKVMVETQGRHLRGALLLDYRTNLTNARIVTEVNQTLLTEMLFTHLQ